MNFLSNKDDIINKLPDPIFAINYERKFLFCNKAAECLLGYNANEIKSMPVTQIFEEGSEVFYNAMLKNKKNSTQAKTKSGQILVLEVTAYDIEEKQQIMICARDITETHNIIANVISEYKENKQKSIKRNLFVAEIAKEFEKPMNSVIGFSQALLEGVGGELNEKQDKYLSIVNKNAILLNNILQAVLDITKLDAEKMPIEKRVFDAASLITLVAQAFIPVFAKKDIDFKFKISGLEKRRIYTDENLFRRLLTILLDNAAKFTQSGSVEISVSNPDLTYARLQGYFIPPKEVPSSYIMVKVSDTGIGIKEENLNLIFDEYSLIEKTRRLHPDNEGTGLSLSIANKIIDALGGTIWVESEEEKGSIFTFIIPAKRDEEEQDAQINE